MLLHELQLKEMTIMSGDIGTHGNQNATQTISFLQQNGQHIGDQDGHKILHASYEGMLIYGIETNQGTIASFATFKNTTINNIPALELYFAFTIKSERRIHLLLKLLWFIKDNMQKPIIDYGSQSPDAIKFIDTLAQNSRFNVSWYNTKTNQKDPYTSGQTTPYRSSSGKTEWRVVLEKSECPTFPTFEHDFSPFGNPYQLFD